MKTWCKKLSEALRAKLEINGSTCGFFLIFKLGMFV